MEGKHSLKHLYNKGKSSQMKPQEFIELMNWFDQNANGMIDEAVEVTEKIDGSSNFIGYDGRIYVETFGFDKKFYDENDFDGNPYEAKAKALLEYATSLPDLEDYLEDLCNDNNCTSIKLQIEMLLTKFSKSEEYCQIVLVPYMFDKLGKDGNGFIIQVLNGDTLQPVKDEHIAVETLCDIMSTENFKVTGTNPKQFEAIDIKEDIQEVKDIIASYTEKMGKSVEEILTSRKRSEADVKKALKAEIEAVQEALQDKLTEAFPVGDYGDYYEGLVFKLTNGMMFKVTSKKFKQFIAEHNHWTEAIENNKIISFFNTYLNVVRVKETLQQIFNKRDNGTQVCLQKITGGVAKVSLYKDGKTFPFENTLEKFEKEILNGIDKEKLPFKISSEMKSGHASISFFEENKKNASLRLVRTGGASGEVFIIEIGDTCKLKSLGTSEKAASGDKTPIQELFTGIVLDALFRKRINTKEEIEDLTNKIKDSFLNFTANTTIDISNLSYNYIGDPESLANTTKNAIGDEWIESFKSLAMIDFSLLTSHINIDKYILLHGTIDTNIENYSELSNILLTKALYSARRDTVNPSDIYFIDKDNISKILLAFDTMKDIKSFSVNWENFLKLQNEEVSNNYWKDFEKFKSLKNFNKDEVYTFIHNYLLSKTYIIGISLKKIINTGHFTFTGGENFFLEKSNQLETSRFVIDFNNIENNTISDYSTSWGISNKGNAQGPFLISSNAKESDLNGSGENLIEIKLAIRTAGTDIPSIESSIQGSGAQGGKGKNGLQSLIGKEALKFSENKLLKDALLSLAESGDLNKMIKNNFEDTNIILDNGIIVNKSSLGNISQELLKNKIEIKDFWSNLSKKSLTRRDINIQKLASEVMKFITGETPLLDKSLEYISSLFKTQKEKEIFKLTLLFAKSLKYQVFLQGFEDIQIPQEISNSKIAFSVKDYFKNTFNNSVVSYFKIS